ncbi:hypothetical protein [Pseudopedobacter beijingensis]|uniref:Chromosome partition protein Smc n=1 Tax=Pseudopedobacter beijingensis TaxID=1207056 RepID=A0ABW4IES0_9SPHI
MKNIISIFFLLVYTTLSAQTVGVSEVTSVENKVDSYQNNEEKIKQLRSKIPDLENQWKENMAKLRAEIAALNKERDNLIADMKVGARCSQCGGWKSDFEKRGESFEKHLGEVKGYAIPATTNEIETTRKSFSEKIAIKKVQLQNLEKGDRALLKQYDEIEKIKKANEKLCEEITQHSKNYERKIINDATGKHNLWLEDILVSGSKALVASSQKKVLKAKKTWTEKEFAEKNKTELGLIKEKNELQQAEKKQQIAENKLQISNLEAQQKQHTETLQNELNELYKAIKETEDKLTKAEGNEVLKNQLVEIKEALIKQVGVLKEKMNRDIEKYKQTIGEIEEKSKKLTLEITQLIGTLGKEQEQKARELEKELNLKLANFKNLETDSDIAYKQYTSEYDDKLKKYKQKQDLFTKEITSESNRMLLASKKINCSVWNETSGKVTLNWNKKLPCVNMFAFPDALMIEEIVGKSTCSNESFFQNGTSLYKSFFGNLTAEEKSVLIK